MEPTERTKQDESRPLPEVEYCGVCGIELSKDEIELCYAVDAEECYCFDHA